MKVLLMFLIVVLFFSNHINNFYCVYFKLLINLILILNYLMYFNYSMYLYFKKLMTNSVFYFYFVLSIVSTLITEIYE